MSGDETSSEDDGGETEDLEELRSEMSRGRDDTTDREELELELQERGESDSGRDIGDHIG